MNYAVSVTLEVSALDGSSKWFWTKESGQVPVCDLRSAEEGGQAHDGGSCVLGQAGSGRECGRRAYAVLKVSGLPRALHMQGGSHTLFAPLCVRSMSALERIAREVAQRVDDPDPIPYLRSLLGLLVKGALATESLCDCKVLQGKRCTACDGVEEGGIDARWCFVPWYACGERARRVFPWFTRTSDAVGNCQVVGGEPLPWLSCRRRTAGWLTKGRRGTVAKRERT